MRIVAKIRKLETIEAGNPQSIISQVWNHFNAKQLKQNGKRPKHGDHTKTNPQRNEMVRKGKRKTMLSGRSEELSDH